MSTQRFSTSKQFVWQGTIYEVKRLLPANLLKIENVYTAESRVVSFSELAQALFSGELHFLIPGQPSPLHRTKPTGDLSDYPEHVRTLAKYRLWIIRPLLSLHPDQRSREVVKARVDEVKQSPPTENLPAHPRVSVASVYRWIKAYQASGNDLRSLAGNGGRQGGKQKCRLGSEVEAIISAVIQDRYYVSEKVTADDLYLEVLLRIEEENRSRHAGEKLKTPSKVTIWRRLDRLDEVEKLIAKRGKRAVRDLLTQYDQMDYPTGPLERVEIDHTRIDLIVVDGNDNLPIGRPTFTYCLDTTTRYPLGFYLGFEPPSYLTVMECLYYAILPKGDVQARYGTQHEWIACGVPSALAVDNGREFIGVDLQDACLSLGIELDQMPLATPSFKAAVERMFETVNTGLIHTLPGTTFSNPAQRGDYPSQEKACIILETLIQMLHIFLLDVYAESFHRGLGDIPARRWETLTRGGFFPRLPTNAEELKTLLGRVAYRTIEPFGIQLFGLRYNTQDLACLRTHLKGEKAKVKYDPTDLEHIFVYDSQEQAYLRVQSLDPDYARGLSLWKHRVIRNLARQEQDKVDVLGLARAKRKIQEIVKESKAVGKSKSRVRIARWETNESLPGNNTPAPSLSPPPSLTPPVSPGPLPDLQIDLDQLEQDGWSAGYDLPREKS